MLDIHVVVEYLTKELGYVVDLLVGHSRGSVTGMMWLCQYPAQSATVRGYANVSGRYRLYVSAHQAMIVSLTELTPHRRNYTVRSDSLLSASKSPIRCARRSNAQTRELETDRSQRIL